ncbi:MAG: hypothetical protein LAO77_11515 [Acidobacteriia bacterium]|nr:hypothetical protein [Terriglobia bacterium]
MLDWPLFLARVARDHLYESLSYYPFRASEYPTRFLCPHGLALACDVNGGVRYVMCGRESRPRLLDLSVYERAQPGAVVWIRPDDLSRFSREALPRMAGPFVLVTSDSDYCLPTDHADAAAAIIGSGQITRWFTTNYDGTAHRDVMQGVPLGLNYPKRNDLHRPFSAIGTTRVDMKPPREQEAEWLAIVDRAPALADRIPKAIGDFQFNDTARRRRFGESRSDIHALLRDNPDVVWLPKRGAQTWLLSEYARHVFVISPHGYGLDCYRTWEALLMGCIPIVKRSPLDDLYRGLPVAIVDDWRAVTRANLDRWLGQFASTVDRAHVLRVLSADYWLKQIRSPHGV